MHGIGVTCEVSFRTSITDNQQNGLLAVQSFVTASSELERRRESALLEQRKCEEELSRFEQQ